MWIIACLHQSSTRDHQAVRVANDILGDPSAHEALRAIAATYVGRMGDAARRRTLFATYQAVPPIIQYAIYYSSRNWPRAEQNGADELGRARLLESIVYRLNGWCTRLSRMHAMLSTGDIDMGHVVIYLAPLIRLLVQHTLA